MAIKHIPDGQDFGAEHFSKDFGFSGSAEGRHDALPHRSNESADEYGDGSYVSRMARGGKVMRRAGGGRGPGGANLPQMGYESRMDRIEQIEKPKPGDKVGTDSEGNDMIQAARGGHMGGSKADAINAYYQQGMPGHDGRAATKLSDRPKPGDTQGDASQGRDIVPFASGGVVGNARGPETGEAIGKIKQLSPLHTGDRDVHHFAQGGPINRPQHGDPSMSPDENPMAPPASDGDMRRHQQHPGIHAYAVGGAVGPGGPGNPSTFAPAPPTSTGSAMPAPAGAMPGTAPQAGTAPTGASLMDKATITMPASAAAEASQKMVALGKQAGAQQAVGALAQMARARQQGNQASRVAPMQPARAGAPTATGGGAAAAMAPGARRPAGPATPGQGIPTMAKGGHHLTAAQRHAMPASDFALPGGRYPIEDANHARAALSRVSGNGTATEKAEVRSAVHRKYPNIGKKG